jgi:hypothetical protein
MTCKKSCCAFWEPQRGPTRCSRSAKPGEKTVRREACGGTTKRRCKAVALGRMPSEAGEVDVKLGEVSRVSVFGRFVGGCRLGRGKFTGSSRHQPIRAERKRAEEASGAMASRGR